MTFNKPAIERVTKPRAHCEHRGRYYCRASVRFIALRRMALRAGLVILTPLVLVCSVSASTQGAEDDMVPVVVRIVSAPIAGIYRVGWVTLGGCDPGHGTSGMSGEVVLTVETMGSPDSTPSPGELMGTPVSSVVLIQPICKYRWWVSFVEATTRASCVVEPDPFAPDDNNEIRISLADPEVSCARHSQIVLRINPSTPVTIDDTDQNAILSKSFTASVEPAKNSSRHCTTASAGSTVDGKDTPADTSDDIVSIVLPVIETTLTGEQCLYDLTFRAPSRLAIVHGASVVRDVVPSTTIDFGVGVDTKKILLLQRVIGDSGRGTARYTLSRECGRPSLATDAIPEPLLPRSTGGGVSLIPPVNVVELREGHFNITAALAADPTAENAFDGVAVPMMNNRGDDCSAVVAISHLPSWCKAKWSRLSHDLADPPGHFRFESIVLEFEVRCEA